MKGKWTEIYIIPIINHVLHLYPIPRAYSPRIRDAGKDQRNMMMFQLFLLNGCSWGFLGRFGNISRERVRQIIFRYLKYLRHPKRVRILKQFMVVE